MASLDCMLELAKCLIASLDCKHGKQVLTAMLGSWSLGFKDLTAKLDCRLGWTSGDMDCRFGLPAWTTGLEYTYGIQTWNLCLYCWHGLHA